MSLHRLVESGTKALMRTRNFKDAPMKTTKTAKTTKTMNTLTAVKMALTLILGAPLFSGCSKTSSQTYTLGGLDYIIVDAGSLTHSGTAISGSGSIVYRMPLDNKAESAHSFGLKFQLEDGASLTLIANADNKLQNGVGILFSRHTNALSVKLLAGEKSTDVSSRFSDIDASGDLSFQLDVHNDESPAHVLVWDASTTELTADNARLNSETEGMECPGQGSASFWGFVLAKAKVTEATVGKGHEVE